MIFGDKTIPLFTYGDFTKLLNIQQFKLRTTALNHILYPYKFRILYHN